MLKQFKKLCDLNFLRPNSQTKQIIRILWGGDFSLKIMIKLLKQIFPKAMLLKFLTKFAKFKKKWGTLKLI